MPRHRLARSSSTQQRRCGTRPLWLGLGTVAFDLLIALTITSLVRTRISYRSWASRLLSLVARRGACHLPDGTAALTASALRVFADEIGQHASAGPCPRVRRPGVLPVPGYRAGQ